MNQQKPEKREERHSKGLYDVQSIFYTIQGEGPFCGTPAVFIRLAGCNLQCPQCDTDYTSNRRLMDAYQIISEVKLAKFWHLVSQEREVKELDDSEVSKTPNYSGLIVITGGEPFRQHLFYLIFKLHQSLNCYVQVESNGTLPPPTGIEFSKIVVKPMHRNFLVVSPKTGTVNKRTEEAACCYKYVGCADSLDPDDGLPLRALDHPASPKLARPPEGFQGVVYLQPVDHYEKKRNQLNQDACLLSCMKHGHTLQLQVHKLVGVL